jgi:tetratricopeptide (TPR) repeat protein
VEETASRTKPLDETGLEILDGLASLLDKSLIRQEDREKGEPRLFMLETIREYAAERLQADAEFSAAVRRAHANYFADFTRRQSARLSGHERTTALEELAADIENVRTAWDYWVENRDREQLNKFMEALWMLYDARGWYHATIELTTDMLAVLSSAPPTPERFQQEILLQTSLARAMQVIKGYTQEVEQAYTRALDLSREVGEIPELFPVLRGLCSLYGYIGQFEKATEMAEKILKMAERLDDLNMQIEGQLRLGYNLAFTGKIHQGLDYLEKAIASYDPDRFGTPRFHLGNHSGVVGLNVSALILWLVGYPERALERAKAALDLAGKLNQPYSLAYARFHTGLLHVWRREAEPARGYAQAVLEVAEEHEFLVWKAVATCLHGAALARLGEAERGLSLVRQGIDSYQGLNTPPVFWPLLVFFQAEACNLAGKPESGLALLDKVMEIIDPNSEDMLAAEFLRLKGDLLLALSPDHAPEAEAWFQRALHLARKLGLPMPELRAAINLSRLWQAQGHTEQARNVLSEAHAKMTEGFTTPDLQEAVALLADLT